MSVEVRTRLRGAAIGLVAAVVAACGGGGGGGGQPLVLPTGGPSAPLPGGTIRTFELVAQPGRLQLDRDLATDVWTYNGTVPGPELRVRQGDLVRVVLHNRLPVGTTIHWHGVAVPNGEDGVAGVTQDPIPPGATARYDFIATTPGTYWYHPHQHSADQEDKGLYGVLVVEPAAPVQPAPQADKVLVVDEWPLGAPQSPPPPGDDPGMAVYGVYTVNGRSGASIDPLRLVPGSLVRVRFVNAGFLTHLLHVHGAPVRIVGTDGHEAVGGAPTTAPLPLAAAERLDVEFTVPAGVWSIHAHDGTAPAAGLRVPILAPGETVPPHLSDTDWEAGQAPLDLATYTSATHLEARPATRNFTLRLGEMEGMAGGMSMGSGGHAGHGAASAMPTPGHAGHGGSGGMSGMPGMPGMSDMPGMGAHGGTMFTINGKVFPQTDILHVAKGDVVALTFVNEGKLVHPMHLHGHGFTVLSSDGRPWASALVKDTVAVPPGGTVVVRFLADNPGVWMIHCHELHHAAAGMDTLLAYNGAPRLAQLTGPGEPAPE